jgi:glycosyltransferase involved in cell wall biosynthesis
MTRVLMAEATDYRSTARVGSHAIARAFLAEGAEVCWIGTPLYPTTLARPQPDPQTRRRVGIWKRGGEITDERLTEYYPFTLLPVVNRPFFRSRFAAVNTLRATIPPVGRSIRRHGFAAPDLLWLSASRFSYPMMSLVAARRRAYRMSDDWASFPEVPHALIDLEARIIDSVDAVFVTAHVLAERVRARRPDVVYLPNGVDAAFFSGPATEDELVRTLPRPRIVFAGTLGSWVDFNAIAATARRLPRASVVLVGPGAPAGADRLPANVHRTGAVEYERLPAILHGCDAGIIPFRRVPRTEAASSNKLFQYLAAGLPVVASRTREFEHTGAPATLCDTADAFADAVADALEHPDVGRPERIAFARAHTWAARFEVVKRTLGV